MGRVALGRQQAWHVHLLSHTCWSRRAASTRPRQCRSTLPAAPSSAPYLPAAWPAGPGRARARRAGSRSAPPLRTPPPPGLMPGAGAERCGGTEVKLGRWVVNSIRAHTLSTQLRTAQHPARCRRPRARTCTAICWSGCATRSSRRRRRCAFSSSPSELHGWRHTQGQAVGQASSADGCEGERDGCVLRRAARELAPAPYPGRRDRQYLLQLFLKCTAASQRAEWSASLLARISCST